MLGIITHSLLEISFSLQQCKNFWNRLRFDKVIAKVRDHSFLGTQGSISEQYVQGSAGKMGPCVSPFKFTQSHRKWHGSIVSYDFLLVIHSNHGSIWYTVSEINSDFCQNAVFFFSVPMRVLSWNYVTPVRLKNLEWWPYQTIYSSTTYAFFLDTVPQHNKRTKMPTSTNRWTEMQTLTREKKITRKVYAHNIQSFSYTGCKKKHNVTQKLYSSLFTVGESGHWISLKVQYCCYPRPRSGTRT